MEPGLCPDAGEILSQLHAIATADVTALLAVRDGVLEVRSTDDLPPEVRAAICSIEKSTGGVKVKFYDKLKALELLGKYLGLFDGTAAQEDPENNLLQILLEGTKEEIDTHDIPELQQAAAVGDDLVEQTDAV